MLNIKLQLPEHFLDEEVRCDYTISHKMKEIWAVELDLLNEFMNVCKKHDLKFFVAGGTLLGTIRHKGYIPWDDDVDVMMFRDDFEKLNKIAPKEFKNPYFWQTEETDKGSMRGHAQLRNSSTTGILKGEYSYKMSFNQGIFIDIFPLDNIPDDDKEKDSFFCECQSLNIKKTFFNYLQYPIHVSFRRNLILLAYGALKCYFLKHFTNHAKIAENAFNKWMQEAIKYDDVNTKKLVMCPFFEDRWIHSRKDLQSTIYMPFEMLEVPVPSGYENILNHVYGNWKKFVKGNSVHGGVVFDPEKPYTEYLK